MLRRSIALDGRQQLVHPSSCDDEAKLDAALAGRPAATSPNINEPSHRDLAKSALKRFGLDHAG